MIELRDIAAELARFRTRVLAVGMLVVACFSLLLGRLVYLQVVRHEDLKEQAESNRTAILPIAPNRGLIVDRNGIVLATNYSAYTLEITPSRTVGGVEETLNELSKLIEITPKQRKNFRKLLEESKSFDSIPILTRLKDEEVARFAAQSYRFPGVEIRARLFRIYPYRDTASHVIGYIGRITRAEKERIEDDDDYANYRGTQYIGKLGVEQSFERQLHGTTGVAHIETSAGGRARRQLSKHPAIPGNKVVLSLDIKLQKLVEDLYGDRRGALVAMNPQTGEILAFVSKPTFDSNLFVEGIQPSDWANLNESADRPLLNRALRGTYPPGSTYKPFMALAALETGARAANTLINDPGYYMYGGHRFGSPENERGGIMDMQRAIVESSNAYFYSLAYEMGVDAIHDFMKPLGFGQLTGIDIQGEVRGVLPSREWKRNYYRNHRNPEQRKWYAGETISLGIGQGYNSFTMLQLAQATATLVNGGVQKKPHLVLSTQDNHDNNIPMQDNLLTTESEKDLHLKPTNMDVIRRAMVAVAQVGTSAKVFAGAGYTSGGKTGTAQAVTIGQHEKYNAAKMEERQRDHSLYIAFAPAEKPSIVLALIVENAGFGAASAAPIARRVFDYWLKGLYPSPQDMLAVSKGQAGAPVAPPLNAAEVPWPRASAAVAASAPVAAIATTPSPTSAPSFSKAASSPKVPVAVPISPASSVLAAPPAAPALSPMPIPEN